MRPPSNVEFVFCYFKSGSASFFFHLLDGPSEEGVHSIKGGRTILGRIFAYQERTGASLKEIQEMPYIQFVLSMADAPGVDYDAKKDKEKTSDTINPGTQDEQLSALAGFLG